MCILTVTITVHIVLFFSLVLLCVDFDVDLSISPSGEIAVQSTPARTAGRRALGGSIVDSQRPTVVPPTQSPIQRTGASSPTFVSGVMAKTQTPYHRATSPTVISGLMARAQSPTQRTQSPWRNGGASSPTVVSGLMARTQSPVSAGIARSHSPWMNGGGAWKQPLSVDTYSSEVTATVQSVAGDPDGPKDSPGRPVVVDIELGRRLDAAAAAAANDDDDDVTSRPLQRLAAMPRPDTPSNVWSVLQQ